MTTTKTDNSKPISIAQHFHRHRREERLTALRQWRRWANAIADGRNDDLPTRAALRDAADILRIAGDATASLEQDAHAVAEHRRLQTSIDLQEAERLALIADAGGMEKLVAAVKAAEAALEEAKKRLAIADGTDASPANIWWAADVQRKHRRIFDDETGVLSVLEARDAAEEAAA